MDVEAVGLALLELIVLVEVKLFFWRDEFFFLDLDCLGWPALELNTFLVSWLSYLLLRYLLRGYFLREVS